jgi:hypothetical protein
MENKLIVVIVIVILLGFMIYRNINIIAFEHFTTEDDKQELHKRITNFMIKKVVNLDINQNDNEIDVLYHNYNNISNTKPNTICVFNLKSTSNHNLLQIGQYVLSNGLNHMNNIPSISQDVLNNTIINQLDYDNDDISTRLDATNTAYFPTTFYSQSFNYLLNSTLPEDSNYFNKYKNDKFNKHSTSGKIQNNYIDIEGKLEVIKSDVEQKLINLNRINKYANRTIFVNFFLEYKSILNLSKEELEDVYDGKEIDIITTYKIDFFDYYLNKVKEVFISNGIETLLYNNTSRLEYLNLNDNIENYKFNILRNKISQVEWQRKYNTKIYKMRLSKEKKDLFDNNVENYFKPNVTNKIDYYENIKDSINKIINERKKKNIPPCTFLKLESSINGFISVGDLVIPESDNLQNNIKEQQKKIALIPEHCWKKKREWNLSDKIEEFEEGKKYVAVYLNPYTNTFKLSYQKGKLPNGFIGKVVPCLKKEGEYMKIERDINEYEKQKSLCKNKSIIDQKSPLYNSEIEDSESNIFDKRITDNRQIIDDLSDEISKIANDKSYNTIINQAKNRRDLQNDNRELQTIYSDLIHKLRKVYQDRKINLILNYKNPADLELFKKIIYDRIINNKNMSFEEKKEAIESAKSVISLSEIKRGEMQCPTPDLSKMVLRDKVKACYNCVLPPLS